MRIRSAKLLVFDDTVSDEELARIRHYYINAVESREKDLGRLSDMEQAEVKPVEVLEGFRDMSDQELDDFCSSHGLALNADDLREVVTYFRSEGRDPYETELRILDTYWATTAAHDLHHRTRGNHRRGVVRQGGDRGLAGALPAHPP